MFAYLNVFLKYHAVHELILAVDVVQSGSTEPNSDLDLRTTHTVFRTTLYISILQKLIAMVSIQLNAPAA
jgi:hypothetical protein